MIADEDEGWDFSGTRSRKRWLPPAERAAERKKECTEGLKKLLRGMARAGPERCQWLTNERHILPDVVNVVGTASYRSPALESPLDLARIAQYLPCSKHRARAASVSFRLFPATSMLFGRGHMTVIRTRTCNMALFYAQLSRQIVEQIPVLVRYDDDPSLPDNKPHVGKLEGKLQFSNWKVQNVVSSGVLPQRGVNLARLMHALEDRVNYDPGKFPNPIYSGTLSDGVTPFCANISLTGMIVLMGLKYLHQVYEAYRMMCDILHEFEDPNVPSGPRARKNYRIKQLQIFSRFKDSNDPSVPKSVRAASSMTSGKDVEWGVLFEEEEQRYEAAAAAAIEDDASIDDELQKYLKMAQETATRKMLSDPSAVSTADGSIVRLPGAEANPYDDGDEDNDPLLFLAAVRGQVQNVRFILSVDEEDMRGGLWARDAKGRDIWQRMEQCVPPDFMTDDHRTILTMMRVAAGKV